MRKFDLEAAKRGEPIQTRGGRAAKFIAHVPEAHRSQRILVLCGKEVVAFYETGMETRNCETNFDLFMAPRKRTVWVNLYPHDRVAQWYPDKELADRRATDERLGNRAWPLEIDR